MADLTLLAPAKINLMLHITGRREDGYHNLQTLFQLLDHGDEQHFSLRDDGQITLEDGTDIPAEDNLVVKAARLLQQRFQVRHGADIQLTKVLPMGGGVGGGSSDCATTLLALNHLWSLHRPLAELAELGLQLGADVPVFVLGHSAWAEGVGEQLQAVELPEKWYLVLKPDIHISTAQVFTHSELTRDTPITTIRSAIEQGGHNDCEPVVKSLFPEVRTLIDQMGEGARLTGTGACVFRAFDDQHQAQAFWQAMPQQWQGFIAKGVARSPVHQQLQQRMESP